MQPIPNIATIVKLFANRKNNYNFLLPLSDERGRISITKNWLEKEIEKEQALFIMDYSSLIEDCKNYLEICVISDEEIKKTVNAMNLYKEATGISDEEITKLKQADNNKYYPDVRYINLEGAKILDIEIALKSQA